MKTSSAETDHGLLLIGHGTRERVGQDEFLHVAKIVRERLPGVPVEACFLEMATPTISEGVARLAALGVKDLTAVPVLLFAAGHAKRDIPARLAEATAAFPELKVQQTGVLACNRHILELSAQRYRQAIAEHPEAPVEDTLMVMVGRGSNDPEATVEMHRFARLRCELTPVGDVEVCFLNMADPRFMDVLLTVSEKPFRRVVVQPHLLFEGELTTFVRQQVAQLAERHPELELVVTAPLGAEQQVADGVLELCGNQVTGIGVGT